MLRFNFCYLVYSVNFRIFIKKLFMEFNIKLNNGQVLKGMIISPGETY